MNEEIITWLNYAALTITIVGGWVLGMMIREKRSKYWNKQFKKRF